jgi:hypothetical protein
MNHTKSLTQGSESQPDNDDSSVPIPASHCANLYSRLALPASKAMGVVAANKQGNRSYLYTNLHRVVLWSPSQAMPFAQSGKATTKNTFDRVWNEYDKASSCNMVSKVLFTIPLLQLGERTR